MKAPPVYKEYPQTISLHSVVNEADASSKQKETENSDFTQAQFENAWKNFAKAENSRRPRLSALLSAQIPQKPENGMIFRFVVGSRTIKDYLYKNIHNTLEGYLRENLHNSNIDLRFEIDGEVEPDNTGMPYTSKEKYVFMLEKNPNLKLLRDIFDLETD